MSKVIDITGQRFGRLIVLEFEKTEKTQSFWKCQCDCGEVIVTRRGALMSGDNVSCGCYNRDKQTTHGMEGTRIYHTWRSMLSRCNYAKDICYHLYGGRGIKVCDRWLHSFENFFEDMKKGYSDKLTIDRIDTNGDYEPRNCKWSTQKEQGNNRRNNLYITIGNITRTLTEWCERYKANYFNVWALINRGHDPLSALNRHAREHKEELTGSFFSGVI